MYDVLQVFLDAKMVILCHIFMVLNLGCPIPTATSMNTDSTLIVNDWIATAGQVDAMGIHLLVLTVLLYHLGAVPCMKIQYPIHVQDIYLAQRQMKIHSILLILKINMFIDVMIQATRER